MNKQTFKTFDYAVLQEIFLSDTHANVLSPPLHKTRARHAGTPISPLSFPQALLLIGSWGPYGVRGRGGRRNTSEQDFKMKR